MKKISYKIALGGIVSSLCILLMFLTAVFPLLSIALPLYAGAILIIVAVEIDFKWAFLSYIAVAALSLFVTPDKEASTMFIMFFGYYPVLRMFLEEKMKNSKIIKWIIKFAVFDVAIVISYKLLISVFGVFDLVDEFGFFGEHIVLKLMILGNLTFVFYDITIAMIESAYMRWFRPTYLKKH